MLTALSVIMGESYKTITDTIITDPTHSVHNLLHAVDSEVYVKCTYNLPNKFVGCAFELERFKDIGAIEVLQLFIIIIYHCYNTSHSKGNFRHVT